MGFPPLRSGLPRSRRWRFTGFPPLRSGRSDRIATFTYTLMLCGALCNRESEMSHVAPVALRGTPSAALRSSGRGARRAGERQDALGERGVFAAEVMALADLGECDFGVLG